LINLEIYLNIVSKATFVLPEPVGAHTNIF